MIIVSKYMNDRTIADRLIKIHGTKLDNASFFIR